MCSSFVWNIILSGIFSIQFEEFVYYLLKYMAADDKFILFLKKCIKSVFILSE